VIYDDFVTRTPFSFEELNSSTRQFMLQEFRAESSGNAPFCPSGMTSDGLEAFPLLVERSLTSGNEVDLVISLSVAAYWKPSIPATSKLGKRFVRRQDPSVAAAVLGTTEFNTWYVRGLARRLMTEGEDHCQVYRAAAPIGEPGSCSRLEGFVLPVVEIYNGHRAKYWPEPVNPYAVSIPAHPNCHHTIRRVRP
jgi:hypothetical protein